MELGTLADWVSAIGGVLAVVAAIVAWRVSQRLLVVEQKRDEQTAASQRREQAELVYVMGAKLGDRDSSEAWAIAVYNGSTKPIFDLVVKSRRLGAREDGKMNPDLRLGAVPPGRFVVPSHPQYHWGALVDIERTGERIDYLTKGKGAEMIQQVTFRDAVRREWKLEGGNQLVEVAS